MRASVARIEQASRDIACYRGSERQ
jgi:hypothetical protein